MKRLFLAVLAVVSLGVGISIAQIQGNYAPGDLMANSDATAKPGFRTTPNLWLSRWCGSTAGHVLRFSSTWGCATLGSLVTGGSNITVDVSSGLPVVRMADMAQSTIKGRAVGAGTGSPQDLTATQATAILNNFVGDSGSGGTKGLVPAPAAGDSAAGKFLKADGSFAAPTAGSAAPTFQGRLTLQSGVPVMITSQSAKSTIYYTCASSGSYVTYYDGSSDIGEQIAGCEVSTALQSSSTGVINNADVFDVWWVHTGANRICVATNGSGAGWSGDTAGTVTARGTGYSQLNRSVRGYYTNANAISNCYNGSTNYGSVSANRATYLGTFYSTAAGQTSYVFGSNASGGTAASLLLWNMHNRVAVGTMVTDDGGAYSYTSATVRQARASAGNQIRVVVGAQEDAAFVNYSNNAITVANSANVNTSVGFDSTTTFACTTARQVLAIGSAALATPGVTPCIWYIPVGLHTLSGNEASDGTNANQFNGTGTNATLSLQYRM